MEILSHIMLVEDDDAIRMIATRTLEKLGKFQVSTCSSGCEALDKVTEINPQLIVLDVMMPGLSGIETLKKLKEMENINKIPVIFSTARVQPSQLEEYNKMDVIGVISKPFDPMALSTHIRELWDKHHHIHLDLAKAPQAPVANSDIDALYNRYASLFPKMRNELIEEWLQMRVQYISIEDWKRLHFMAHKLAGSSGSFGYVTEHEILRKLELILEPLQHSKPSSITYAEIDNLIVSLKNASMQSKPPTEVQLKREDKS